MATEIPSRHTEAAQFLPRRIVSLQPSATVILDRLGLLERVAACTRHCLSLCPAASGRLIVEDSWSANAQEITAAHPDLVIASVPYQREALAEILKSGTRFLGLSPRSLADIYSDIAVIANLFAVGERGSDLIAFMQQAMASARERARASSTRPRVYCEEWGKPMLRSQPWVAELVECAGGEFVGRPATPATAEEIAAAEPDVIVAAWCGAGDRVPLEKMVHDRDWMELRAVQQRRVYCIRDELLTTPTPTLIEGLHCLAAALHPGIFSAPSGLRQIK